MQKWARDAEQNEEREKQRQIVHRDRTKPACSLSLLLILLSRRYCLRVRCQVNAYEKESVKVLMGAWSINTQPHRYRTHMLSQPVLFLVLCSLCKVAPGYLSITERRHKYT